MAKYKSFEEMVEAHKRTRPHARDDEHRLQCACVRWFALAYPKLRGLLFAVPNGGRRDAATGARLKEEGVVPGVADLLLLVPSAACHGLCIEMKTRTGSQSQSQKKWQAIVERMGYRYVLCRSFDDFQHAINEHLCNNNQDG